MTSIFRQAFLNTSGGGQSSFGGGFSRTPSIPSGERFVGHSPMPIHTPIPTQNPNLSSPTIQTTSLNVGVDYQGNGFTSVSNLRTQASQLITEKFPNHTPEEQQNMIEASVAFHTQEIKNNLDHKRGFAKLALPLPEGTTWQDIKIYLVEYDGKNPQNSKIEIHLNGSRIKILTIADMGLMDFVTNTISRSGEILLLICAGKKLIWDTDTAPSYLRKAKERLSQELIDFFGIGGYPFMLGTKKFNAQFNSGIKSNQIPLIQETSISSIFQKI